ncbi:MAG: hypothetical protein N2511_07925 [Thermodesulfovibrionales bacterium]|nr:hypothetical protein [Thermodesulfovibrionales bacterium]
MWFKPIYRQNLIFIIFAFLSFSVFLSCASVSQKAIKDPTELLKETATDYWRLRMADRYEDTYKMEYKEGLPPYSEYLNQVKAIKRFSIVGHSLKNFSVENEKGVVDIEFSFILPPVTKPLTQTIKDEWIYVNGKWYHKLPK